MDKEERDATAIVIANAFGAMMKVFLVAVIGVVSAKYPKGNPLLPVTVIRHISRFSNIVLIPCLTIGNIGASISLPLLLKVGILVPVAIGNNLMAMGIGRIFKFLHEDDPKLFLASLLTIASPNSISMPIMVMQSLCEQPAVKSDFDNDATICFSHSTALLFIYSIGFHLLYWGYVFPTFEQLQKDYEAEMNEENKNQNNSGDSSSKSSVSKSYQQLLQFVALFKHILMSPTMLGVLLGLFIGLIPFTRHILFSENGYLSPVGGAINTLASPVVALNCLIMSASLAHIDVDFKQLFQQYWSRLFSSSPSSRRQSIQLSSSEEDIEMTHPTAFNPLVLHHHHDNHNHNHHHHDNQNHLQTTSASSSSSLSNTPSDPSQLEGNSEMQIINLEKVLTEVIKDEGVEQSSVDTSSTRFLSHNQNNLPHSRSVFFLILCRLILPPLMTLLFVRLAVLNGFISKEERLFQFIIIIVSASPSAQVIIVSLNQLGFQKLAGQIAYMYVFQYLASILSITFIATTALRIIYSSQSSSSSSSSSS